jgi:hypothetical protein
MNIRLLALALVSAAILAGAMLAGNASAATPVVKCDGKTYGGIDRNTFPVIYNLRAINLPRKTDGYAPRCLVAESIGGMVQVYAGNHSGRIPTKVHIGGARWDGGTWRISYRMANDANEDPYAKFTATHGRERVTFDGAS